MNPLRPIRVQSLESTDALMNRLLITPFAMLALSSLLILPAVQAQKRMPTKQRSEASPPATGTARILDSFGTAGIKARGASGFTPLKVGGVITPQSMLRTGQNAALLLLLPNGHRVRVGENSIFVLSEPGKENTPSMGLLSGQMWVSVRAGAGKVVLRTPSAVVFAANALFGVGYDLESSQSMVSTGDGSVEVSLPSSAGWREKVDKGQYIRHLRNPEPNIRLRSPELLPQPAAQKTMWNLLRAENWTDRARPGDNSPRLKRGQEKALRQLTFSVTVENQ